MSNTPGMTTKLVKKSPRSWANLLRLLIVAKKQMPKKQMVKEQ
jgi:hypothetical protein